MHRYISFSGVFLLWIGVSGVSPHCYRISPGLILLLVLSRPVCRREVVFVDVATFLVVIFAITGRRILACDVHTSGCLQIGFRSEYNHPVYTIRCKQAESVTCYRTYIISTSPAMEAVLTFES
ncbi:hypothetical protein QBC35DRAFT_91629 [Podospora australis]|uniref:Uncharacterized protein n=1 Tax=Podospora australis TaxID=1536484 RepID=A0AAN6WKU4_9PEZI|nr:hypothetical protein QBC35DRAFT_91629 [Podospora australis]